MCTQLHHEDTHSCPRYLGVLDTQWCLDSGALLAYGGSPVLVNSTLTPDPEVEAFVEELAGPVQEAYKRPIGVLE